MAAIKAFPTLLLLLMVAAAPVHAALSPQQLAGAVAKPDAGTQLPRDLRFADQNGATVTLPGVAGGRPLVLLFADYTCRNICGPGASIAAGALTDTGLHSGRDYALAVIGIDPRDSRAAARAFGANLGKGAVAKDAALLTGTPATIDAATRRLGYGFAYDAEADQFAHDASVYVFDGSGRLITLLPELGLQPPALRAALAGRGEKPGLGEQVARLCYGLAAAHGRFGRPIVLALQGMALLTIAAMAWLFWRRRQRA